MRLIDPEIQIKIDELKEEKEILLQKYIHYSEINDVKSKRLVEAKLNCLCHYIVALELIKYM